MLHLRCRLAACGYRSHASLALRDPESRLQYVYIYISLFIHLFTYLLIYMYVYICMYMYICSSICLFIHSFIYIDIYTYAYHYVSYGHFGSTRFGSRHLSSIPELS